MAERTGLEPATPGVTGRYSNQLNYRSSFRGAGLYRANLPDATQLSFYTCRLWRGPQTVQYPLDEGGSYDARQGPE